VACWSSREIGVSVLISSPPCAKCAPLPRFAVSSCKPLLWNVQRCIWSNCLHLDARLRDAARCVVTLQCKSLHRAGLAEPIAATCLAPGACKTRGNIFADVRRTVHRERENTAVSLAGTWCETFWVVRGHECRTSQRPVCILKAVRLADLPYKLLLTLDKKLAFFCTSHEPLVCSKIKNGASPIIRTNVTIS